MAMNDEYVFTDKHVSTDNNSIVIDNVPGLKGVKVKISGLAEALMAMTPPRTADRFFTIEHPRDEPPKEVLILLRETTSAGVGPAISPESFVRLRALPPDLRIQIAAFLRGVTVEELQEQYRLTAKGSFGDSER